ncbi:precorrin-4 C(11)-methyltransferase [Pelotomaculum propionicicum]|uniref:Cobalt-precorrin-4 C(11)-methyltransferase n=1 Tax=Pelotomaculum propionicicum TaxID=258475 RepID=A0A4Y7RT52_9FIRM|nr:precorrin-4 C(11)-methyltransferase [Pelotomaculum propionicicum]NLI13021.1 precorrin-4 C(11)-methyltransferase [Peptococcaceae bacterium]TEB11930.1 Cobalt-precorrin-4 C(11)-methyltransferase [Pelotomaculum propionicicum]
MKVYFIGAGPGAVDLITVRGREILARSQVVIYAGSLVSPEHLAFAPATAETHDSSGLTLEDIRAILISARERQLDVARLHTGDPSLYGAVREQVELCEELNLAWEIVPGVSSAFAAAARLGVEYTVPDGTQTLIFSRVEGRTPVPAGESLDSLARHQSSLAIFLSVQEIEKVTCQLIKSLPPTTPVVVAYRVTWPDESFIRGNLADIAEKVRKAGINRTALILVGEALTSSGRRSLLYHGDFKHGYR